MTSDSGPPDDLRRIITAHLRQGWWLLALFLTLGVALESMLAFKLPFYTAVDHSIRREVWRLAHAHGTLLAVLNLVFAGTMFLRPTFRVARARFAGRLLTGASLLIPLGFFLGGAWISGAGDPGLLIALVPLGAAMLLGAALFVALGIRH